MLEERQGLPGQRALKVALSLLANQEGMKSEYTRNGLKYLWEI